MIIAIDGGDGCGKSTLARMLSEYYGFYYIKKPIDNFLHVKNDDSIMAKFSRLVQKIVYDINKNENIKVAFNSALLLYYRKKLKNENVIIDRGPLSCYLFNGSEETNSTFDFFINNGLDFDLNIFLKASNQTRLQRLAHRNGADPDLDDEKIGSLSDNQERTLEYARSRKLHVLEVDTDGKTPEEVFEIVRTYIDKMIAEAKAGKINLSAEAEMIDDE